MSRFIATIQNGREHDKCIKYGADCKIMNEI